MRHLFVPLVLGAFLALSAQTANAQDDSDSDMLRRGLDLFLEGLQGELDDSLRDLQDLADSVGPAMQDFLKEMGPALADLMNEVEDWNRYELPQMLPNGDILIRRKPDRVVPGPDGPDAPDKPGPDGPDPGGLNEAIEI
ncbi:MAG: hypothetical protein ACWA5A_01335 [Marinibacterium sp.]